MQSFLVPLIWIGIGLIAGIAAKWVLPGKSPGGCVLVLLGILGGVLGGLLATGLGFGGVLQLDYRSLMLAFLGADLLLLAGRLIGEPRR